MQVNVSQRELPALLGIFKGNMVEIHASVCHLLLSIFRGSQGAFVGQHLRDTLCALRCHGGHDEYHGEHHHRYQNLHAVGDQGRQLSGGQLRCAGVDDDPRAMQNIMVGLLKARIFSTKVKSLHTSSAALSNFSVS